MKRKNSDSPLFAYYHCVSEMIAMKEKGFTMREIAIYFNTSVRQVTYHIKTFDKKFSDQRKK
jgi:DNA-binding CsgD family transcriptional regulator